MTGRPRPPSGGHRWVASAGPFTFTCSSLHFRLHFIPASYLFLFYYAGSYFCGWGDVCLVRGAGAGTYVGGDGGYQPHLGARRAVIVPSSSWMLRRRSLWRCPFTVRTIPLTASHLVLCIRLGWVWEGPHLEASGPGAAVGASAAAAIPPTGPARLPDDGGC